MKAVIILPGIFLVILILFATYVLSPAPARWITVATVDHLIANDIEIMDVEYFNRIWLSCSIVKFSVNVPRNATGIELQEVSSVAFERELDRSLFDTTASWGKECIEDENVREDYLSVINDPMSLIHISDSRESILIIDEPKKKMYYVERS